jgi:uncharacterized protein YndB with AHSA1/START domain
MNNKPLLIEREFNAPIAKIWDALTKNELLKKWYFQLPDFKPVEGFEFQFTAKAREDVEYVHLCRVIEVIPGRKIAYTWRYDGYPGNSIVTFELFPEGNKSKLTLTHTGLDSFASAGPDFSKESFTGGWTFILDKSLKGFLESEPVGV